MLEFSKAKSIPKKTFCSCLFHFSFQRGKHGSRSYQNTCNAPLDGFLHPGRIHFVGHCRFFQPSKSSMASRRQRRLLRAEKESFVRIAGREQLLQWHFVDSCEDLEERPKEEVMSHDHDLPIFRIVRALLSSKLLSIRRKRRRGTAGPRLVSKRFASILYVTGVVTHLSKEMRTHPPVGHVF